MNQISPVRLIALTLCSTFVLITTACGPSHPSEADGQAALERRYNSYGTIAKVDSLTKTDGQDINANGVQSYLASYDATSECIAASGCAVCSTLGVDSVLPRSVVIKMNAAGGAAQCTLLDRGAKFTTHSKIIFQKSEKGWTGY